MNASRRGFSGFVSFASVALFSVMAIAPGRADAAPTEGAQNAPDVLEYPGVTPAGTGTASVYVSSLRDAVEDATNTQICRALMTNDKKPIPQPFNWSTCPVNYQNMVKGRQGIVRWAAGAKPSECNLGCVQHPQAWRDSSLDRPNTNDVLVTGSIVLEIDVPGPNRNVSFAWRAYARCVMPPASAQQGTAKIDAVVDPPVVGPPGFFEGVLNFFLGPIDWSNRITAGVQQHLSTPGGQTTSLSNIKCTSIGFSTSANPKQDSFEYAAKSVPLIGSGRTATVHLNSSTRKPVFGYTPSTPDAGSFLSTSTGLRSGFPPILRSRHCRLPVAPRH